VFNYLRRLLTLQTASIQVSPIKLSNRPIVGDLSNNSRGDPLALVEMLGE